MFRLVLFTTTTLLLIAGCSQQVEEASQAQPEPVAEVVVDSLELANAEVYEALTLLKISVDQEIDSLRKVRGHFATEIDKDSLVIDILKLSLSMIETLSTGYFNPIEYMKRDPRQEMGRLRAASVPIRIKGRADLRAIQAESATLRESLADHLYLSILDAGARVYTSGPYHHYQAKLKSYGELEDRAFAALIDSLS